MSSLRESIRCKWLAHASREWSDTCTASGRQRMRRRSRHTFFILLLAFTLDRSSAAAATLAASGDASISQDASAGTYTLRAGGAALTLAVDRSRDFEIVSLISPSGQTWAGSAVPDSSVHVGSRTLPFGNRAAGFSFESADATTRGHTLQLDVVYVLASAGLTLTRHYAIVPGSPSFETWTTYSAAAAS